MRILVVGGTQFVGRHLVEAALAAGHRVTLFHRGTTNDDLFPVAEHRHGDRDGDLAGLATGRWDATVDVSAYFPRQVAALADALGERAGHLVYVSTVSVYAPPAGPGYDEDSPLATVEDPEREDIGGGRYGGLKAACEQVARDRFGDAVSIVRPTYVVGPWDHTGRFTSWVRRLAAGGEVLVPGPARTPVQVVDARDLAAFTLLLATDRVAGAFHAVSPAPPFGFGDLVAAVADVVAPAGTTLTTVDADFLDRHRVVLPLFDGGADSDVLAADPARALAAGLAPRPLAETVRDLAGHPGTPLVDGVGLTRDRERELLAAWHAR